MDTINRPFKPLQPRLPPQDLEVERALLGSLLLKPGGLHEVADAVKADDFYAERHGQIFKLMLLLQESGYPVDLVSLVSLAKEKKLLASVGGHSYLAELTGVIPSAANLKYYAEIIGKKAALRRLIQAAEQITELGYREEEEIETVFDQAEKSIFGLVNFARRTLVSLKDTLAEAWERFENLHKAKDGIRGVSSGFRDLDNLLSGFQKSDLIILAARPSMGKTSLALDIARYVACQLKLPVGIFSLEMSAQQLVDRLIAAESRVDAWKLRTGRLSADEEFSRIRDTLDVLSQAPLFIDDDAQNGVHKMKAVARRLKSEHGLGLLVVDYLQLMIPRRESDSLVQQVTEISRSLKGLARELDVPVLALSQLNRAVEQRGGRPRLSDLRDSGSIEQDADVVMFIHREDKYNEESDRKNIAEILVEKHRNGPTGKVELYFDDKRVSFTTIDKSDFGGL